MSDSEWEKRVAEAWATMDDHSEEDFLALMTQLSTDPAVNDGGGLYERAGAYDSTGHEDVAIPLYRQALELGLPGDRRRRAIIQLASSLRNVREYDKSVALLEAELARGTGDLDDEVRAFLSLALIDSGREREALSVALTALAPHLQSYRRSVDQYARFLVHPEDE